LADPFYWQLRYLDGKITDELLNNSSVLNSRANATHLIICRHSSTLEVKDLRTPVTRVDLNGWVPIFYRKRNIDFSHLAQKVKLSITVFGKAREGSDVHIESQLWAIYMLKDKEVIIDCPSWAIDKNMIQHQISER